MKDKKININVGYEKLSKEEIESHKDFSKIHESYLTTKMKPMEVVRKFTFTKMIVVTTTVAIVTVSVWKYTSVKHTAVKTISSVSVKHSPVIAKHDETLKKPFIHPPIKRIDVPYKSYTIDVAKGGILAYNKSKINIPSNAFCDEKGNDIKGSVTINYREFHDVIDFFVSGIPMTYDSAGVRYNFESAGMLDIKGIQNGKPVYIKQGKNIQVTMSSFQTGTKYNVYKLDTVKRNWTYIEKSKYTMQKAKPDIMPKQYTVAQQPAKQDVFPVASFKTETELANNTNQIKKLEAEKPVKASDDNYRLSIDADTVTLPELAIFKNVIFEVDPSDKEYRPEWENTEWTDAKLTKANNEKSYIFTVSKGSVKHTILVNPVFQGKDFDNAMKEYNQKYNAYLAKMEAEKEEIRKQKEAYKKMMTEDSIRMIAEVKEEQRKAKELKTVQQQQVAMFKIQKQQAAAMGIMQQQMGASVESNVTNYFTLNSFGFWNSDNPMLASEKVQLAAQYTDKQDDDLNSVNTYLIQKDKNAIIENHPGHKCCFDPNERNFIWAVTPDQKLAIYSEQDFDKIKQTSGNFTFVMTVLDKKISTEEDIKSALEPYMD